MNVSTTIYSAKVDDKKAYLPNLCCGMKEYCISHLCHLGVMSASETTENRRLRSQRLSRDEDPSIWS